MEKIEDVLIETPRQCPLRKYNYFDMKHYCRVINTTDETIPCVIHKTFPNACQLANKNICIMRGR